MIFMPGLIIVISFAWPIILGTVGGVVVAAAGLSDNLMGAFVMLSFAGVPGVMGGVHRLWPEQWSELSRALFTLGLSVVLVVIQVLAAMLVFWIVFFLCNGGRLA
jgi:hypothetical protein